MMPLVDMALWSIALVLVGVAARLSLRQPPSLDWEIYFKLVLTTLLRGEVEADEGTADDWYRLGKQRVWFHPAARNLEAKLRAPESHELPVPALEGEQALLQDLVAIEQADDRIARIFSREGGDELLYDDPDGFGDEYDPASMFGPGVDWENIAAWSDVLVTALQRRSERWVFLGASADLEKAMTAILPAESVSRVDVGGVSAVADALEGLVPDRADRLVLVTSGRGALVGTQAMHDRPVLRDRVLAVIGIGADLGGDGSAWLEGSFNHVSMDTEVARATSWFHLAFLSPGVLPLGDENCPLSHTAWPCPPVPASGRASIETIDLGVLPGPRSDYPKELLGRALFLTVTARLCAS